MLKKRKITSRVMIGDVAVGGGARVSVQSMTNTRTADHKATIRQIRALEKAGCEIVRSAIIDKADLESLPVILRKIGIPLVADIHFDYRMALGAIECGCSAVRINPGNIGSEDRVKLVLEAAGGKGIPIRIGLNAGSLPQEYRDKFGSRNDKAMVACAGDYVKFFEKQGFYEIIISLKSSSVNETLSAYRMLSGKFPYPLHLGVTEAGSGREARIKSTLAMGLLLLEGIGDTLRVSLTEDPVNEIVFGRRLIKKSCLE